MMLRRLFDMDTRAYTYLVGDEETRQAALIDPVLECGIAIAALLKIDFFTFLKSGENIPEWEYPLIWA